MTTLLALDEDARETLEDGQAILLKDGNGDGFMAVGFADDYPNAETADWEPEEGWDNLKQ